MEQMQSSRDAVAGITVLSSPAKALVYQYDMPRTEFNTITCKSAEGFSDVD
ncbi:hypothetical protein FOYG_07692 [Fusarium oxysporum NRRL 32931]|uniref:Uncharacterized protein n=1 Tax=Fusarium oxysporum NRRL 32931 TaxID=660029 RepID=W9I5A8_FUSOX|nr:hypothetical protein FOYG_07692 [Fusarium oxysporum NRRL 32931]